MSTLIKKLNIKKCSKILGIKVQTLHYHIQKGNLKAKKEGYCYFVIQKDLYDFWYFYESYGWKKTGIEKVPSIIDFDKNPNLYTDRTKQTVARDREIMTLRKNGAKYVNLSEKYNLHVRTIYQIRDRNL